MKKYALILIGCFILLLSIAVVGGCAPASPGEAKTLKFGVVTSVTGPTAPAFKGLYDAMGPIEELLNQKGGITVGGQKYLIDIVAEDDQSSPPGAVAAANRLVQSGVKFVVSPIFPPNLIAMTPITEEAKVISMQPMQMDPTPFTKQNRYSFNTCATAYNVIPAYNYIQKNYPNVKRIAYVSPDDPGPNFVIDWVYKECKNRGLEIVAHEKYPATTQDFYPILSKVLAAKPDLIDLLGGIPPWAVGITNQSRELGYTGPIFCTCMFGDINIANGMLKPEYAYGIINMGPDVLSDKMTPIVKDLRKIMEKTKPPFTADNVMLLNAMMPALQGIEKAQSFDTDKVVAAIESLSSVETAWGTGKWKGEEFGLSHLLVLDRIPCSKIVKGGKVEFEWVGR